ncbi:MurR/RpiR family transcriptional regulator [Priestia megaterium]
MPGCLLKLKEEVKRLSDSEKKVANYILEYPKEVVGMPIGELATKCQGSKAAIIRMCQRLNYKGYREFGIDLASDLAFKEPINNKYTDIKPGDNLKVIMQNVFYNNQKSIEDTISVLEYKEVERAIQVLHKAQKITFFGAGASGLVATDVQHKFLRINKVAFSYPDYHIQAATTATLSEGDVAVVISDSGETRDTVAIANIAKDRGGTVVSITRYGSNTLSKVSDINLFFSSPETTIRSGAMGSRIAQLTILDILFSGVASLEYPEIEKYLDRTREVISSRKFRFEND